MTDAVVNGRGQHDLNILKLYFALEDILISTDSTCKTMVRKIPCPAEEWHLLKSTYQAVSEAVIDAKWSKLHTIKSKTGEKIITYSNWIVELA